MKNNDWSKGCYTLSDGELASDMNARYNTVRDDIAGTERNHRNMSFVGIVMTEKAIVAFGDSKSTVFDTFGNRLPERNREVRKVFKIDDSTVMATFGNNKISIDGNIVFIEDYIDEFLKTGADIQDMMEDIVNHAKEHGGEYNFLIGTHRNNRTYAQHFIVNGDGATMRNREFLRPDKTSFLVNTISVYSDESRQPIEEIDRNADASSVVDSLRKILTHIILQVDADFVYNPVGFPLQFASVDIE